MKAWKPTPNTNRNWKRFFAVGCSHGHLADREALDTVLAFRKRWKPDLTIHLGDFLDLSPLMGNGRKAESDRVQIADDFMAGVEFLKELEPNLVFSGNHEDRIYKLQEHSNGIISYAANKVAEELAAVLKDLRAEFVPYDIQAGWRKIGDTRFGHGYMFSENALRDHAELVGKCVIAHLHPVPARSGQGVWEEPQVSARARWRTFRPWLMPKPKRQGAHGTTALCSANIQKTASLRQ